MTVSAQSLQAFRDLLAATLGLEFPDERAQLLGEVLLNRAVVRHHTVESYLGALADDALRGEFSALAARLTVPESYFFRNTDQFNALRESVLPDLLADRSPSQPFRVLSAGCASGEEPYSLGITLNELLPRECEVSIVAVDLNPEALERARRGLYSEWALRETDSAARAKWFTKSGRDFQLHTQALGFVQFVECNLAGPTAELLPKEHYDLIFCRNFLMYLTREKYLEVASKLGRALVPGGFLFLGHAETLRGADAGFETQQSHGTFYYRKTPRPDAHRSGAQRQTLQPRLPEADPATLPWYDAISQATARIVALSEQLGADAARSKQAPDAGAAEPSGRNAPITSPHPAVESAVAPVLSLLRQERYPEALSLVDTLTSSVDRGVALLLRALLLTHAGRAAEAEQACSELLELDAGDAGAHYVLALCRDEASDAQGALRHYERAAALDPTFALPRLQLGLLQRRLGDAPAARRNLVLACALLDRETDGRVLLFGGGFKRDVLVAMGLAALRASEQGAA
jgi:chemotaxis protein methyltransferase CheR